MAKHLGRGGSSSVRKGVLLVVEGMIHNVPGSTREKEILLTSCKGTKGALVLLDQGDNRVDRVREDLGSGFVDVNVGPRKRVVFQVCRLHCFKGASQDEVFNEKTARQSVEGAFAVSSSQVLFIGKVGKEVFQHEDL